MFQVKSINIMGLSANSKSKFRNQGIPFKIKEIVASSKYVPTLYILTETKLKCNHQRIKLPRSLRYAGETSGITAKAGIFIFHDKSLIIENRKDNVVVITSQYAMYIKIKVFQKSYEFICVYLPSENKHCQKVLKDIDEFINRRNITNFTLIGDTNIDFSKTEHRSKARTFLKLAEKYHLINLVDKLNCSVEYSWRGRGERWNSKSRPKFDHQKNCLDRTWRDGGRSHCCYGPRIDQSGNFIEAPAKPLKGSWFLDSLV